MSLGHEIRNLVEGANDKVDELHLDNGPQPQIAHSAGRADHGALADRRINHAFPAKALQYPLACLECPAIHPYVFPHRSEEHTSELQSRLHLVCRLLLEKKKSNMIQIQSTPTTT